MALDMQVSMRRKQLAVIVSCEFLSILLFVLWINGTKQEENIILYVWAKMLLYPLALILGGCSVWKGLFLLAGRSLKTSRTVRIIRSIPVIVVAVWYLWHCVVGGIRAVCRSGQCSDILGKSGLLSFGRDEFMVWEFVRGAAKLSNQIIERHPCTIRVWFPRLKFILHSFP